MVGYAGLRTRWPASRRSAGSSRSAHLVGATTTSSCPARRRCDETQAQTRRSLVLAVLLATLVVLPSTASADPLSQKRARAREIMKQLAVLDTQDGEGGRAVQRGQRPARRRQCAASRSNERNLAIARYNLADGQDRRSSSASWRMYKQRPVEMLDVMLATKSFYDAGRPARPDQPRRARATSTVVDSIGTLRERDRRPRRSRSQTDRTAAATAGRRARRREGQRRERAGPAPVACCRASRPQIAAAPGRPEQAPAQQARPEAAAPTVRGTGARRPTTAASSAIAAAVPRRALRLGRRRRPTGFDCSGFTMYVYAQLRHQPAAQRRGAAGQRDRRCSPARPSPATSSSSASPPTTSASTSAAAA